MEKYYKVFDDYVSNYDFNDERIKMKYNHSYRVMKLSEKYAKILKFSEDDIKLATVIGLLHDIGRFEQLKIYNTFEDSKSIDHANYGVKVLFEDGIISKFWDNEDDYEIIKFAIKNHNKFKMEETKDKRTLMHAKLIRDTDKTDIIYTEGKLDEAHTRSSNDNITEKVEKLFLNGKPEDILKKDLNNTNDHIALYFAYAFDINNYEILEELKRNYKWFYETIKGEEKFNKIYKKTLEYIDERIDKKC